MIRQRTDAGAEFDVFGAFGDGGDDQLRRRNQFGSGRMVLADPRFVVAQRVEPRNQLEISMEKKGGINTSAVHRREKYAESHDPCLAEIITRLCRMRLRYLRRLCRYCGSLVPLPRIAEALSKIERRGERGWR